MGEYIRCKLKLPPHKANHQEVGNVRHQRSISGNVHNVHLCNASKAEPTLASKPTRDIVRNTEQGLVRRQKSKLCKMVDRKIIQNW